MKLKKLQISNLASIATAEIDFTAEPLKSSPIFLLCGETGVGKTTILDAICLALYGRTPRFCDNKDDKSALIGDMAYNNLRQLVRRGSKSASATVVLEGNDGRTYEARWSVDAITRGSKKGQLNKDVCEWRDCAPGGGTYRHESELLGPDYTLKTRKLGGIVGAAIGLDFDQFCRTTMLAQGQFTKFLLAGDDEKALILEKLTNTERFAAIGKQIKASYDAAEAAVDAKQRELDAKAGMGAAEREAVAGELRDREAEAVQVKKLAGALEGMVNWIVEGTRLGDGIAAAEKNLKAARDVLAGPAFAAKAQDVREWDATQEVHAAVRDRASAMDEERRAAEELRKARQEFGVLRGGCAGLQTRVAEEEEALAGYQSRLDAEQIHEPMYAACAAIVQNLADARAAEAAVAKLDAAKVQEDAARADLEARAEGLADAVKAATAKVRAKQEEIEAAEKRRDALDIERVRAEQKAVQDRKELAIRARERARALAQTETDLKRRAAALEERVRALDAQREALPGLAEKSAAAAEGKRRAEIDLERQRALVTDGVKRLVAGLHVGDSCPVCGNRIEHLAAADSFQALFDELDGRCREARRMWDEAVAAQNKAVAAIASEEKGCGQDAHELEAARKLLGERRDELGKAAATLGLARPDEAAFIQCADTCGASLARLDGMVREYEKANQAVISLARDKEKLASAENQARGAQDGNRSSVATSQVRSDGYAAQARERRATAAEKLAAARAAIAWTDWESDWRADAMAFEARLKAAAKGHADLKSAFDTCAHRRDELRARLDAVLSGLGNVESEFPEWRTDPVVAVAARNDLQAAVTGFVGRTGSLKGAHAAAQRRLDGARAACAVFLAAHRDLTEARLDELSRMKIDVVRQEVAAAQETVSLRQGALEKAREAWNEHGTEKPADLSDVDTLDGLKTRKAEQDARQVQVLQRIGELKGLLAEDDQRAQARALKEAELEDAKRSRDAWKPLYDLYGDADGKKIRRVIQAYVLANVLARANGYLRKLCPDRYELSSVGLTLTVRDAFEGGVERPAKTLSGGEGFLVSLALALGLANMNETGLAVDMLFIDEGFGTLSKEHLEKAVDALESLNQVCGSRRIGIISHVDRLKERIRTHVEVTRRGHEPSMVNVR